ncbi:outer membrane protein assembly factor BamE [Pseudoalteromonas fenneropenaei]|uniref:Outer membrane protein assembly factor BamE n=1 Tax=Pseudoalteromonas fenneropenaei TaxID=1737459 RepID=A0ABV7CLH5_9GAMM
MKNKFIIALFALVLAACSSTQSGKDFDMEVVKSFKKGQTTQEDVRTAIGDPTGMDDMANGDVVWTYEYYENKSSGLSYVPVAGVYAGGSKGEQKFVTIKFDAKGVMNGLSMREVNSGSSHF